MRERTSEHWGMVRDIDPDALGSVLLGILSLMSGFGGTGRLLGCTQKVSM